MPKHEFGIMNEAPRKGDRYDKYEPQKYHCISIDDTYIEPILEKLHSVTCYWHTLAVKENGLAYCGITLIPPESIKSIKNILGSEPAYQQLKDLLDEAECNHKFVICFGI